MSGVLLADIGGTYARFAVASGNTVGPVWSTEVRARHGVVDAIRDYLSIEGGHPRIEGALLAVAGPCEGGRCRLTNAAWTIDEEEIARTLGFRWVRIVNDIEAVAAGLPELAASQTRLIGPEHGLIGAPMAIVSPGTGLGMACLLAGPDGRRIIPSEGGHVSLAGIDARYDRLIAILRRRHEHVSAERVLSGQGLVNLYEAISAMEGCAVQPRGPSEITAGAFDGSCPLCRAAVDAFCVFLGAVAGDAALTFGARGGVFIGGGIVPRFVDHLARSAFRQSFEAKGRMHSYMTRIPTRVILHPTPAFAGLISLVTRARDRRPRVSAVR
jgi:glucokinase